MTDIRLYVHESRTATTTSYVERTLSADPQGHLHTHFGIHTDMKQLLLSAGCGPLIEKTMGPAFNTSSESLLSAIIKGCAVINDTSVPVYVDIIDTNRKPRPDETDSGAVLYIVAVLVFYSAGIVVMIIKYLKREKRELEEERTLEDFFRSMPAYRREREQKNVNKMAIHAFHALTSFSYDDDEDDNISEDYIEVFPNLAVVKEHVSDVEDGSEKNVNVSTESSDDLLETNL